MGRKACSAHTNNAGLLDDADNIVSGQFSKRFDGKAGRLFIQSVIFHHDGIDLCTGRDKMRFNRLYRTGYGRIDR